MPLAHTLGAWLLDEAGLRRHPRRRRARTTSARLVRDLPGPVGVLAMGDGSARRTVKAPGYLDDAGRALRRRRRRGPWRTAMPPHWPALDPAAGERLLAAGCRPGGRSGRRWPAGTSPPGCTSTPRRSASATSSPTGSPRERTPPVVAVVGPTATGKTALAVELARRLGGEVVNADSMQLYRGMDIGTAKPDAAERGGVPHHLLDLWHVRQPASVAEYRDLARAEIDRLRAAGTVPLLVGGSGLYVRAVLDELDFPGTDAAVRARLEEELAEVGPAAAARAAGRRSTRRPRRRSCPATDGGSCGRWRSSSSPADRSARSCRSRGRTIRPSSSGWTGTRPSWTSGSRCGWTACGRRGSSRRWRRSPPTACARARRRPGRWATPRCWRSSTATLTPRRGAGAHGRHHPPVRAPATVVVPPRPGAHLVRRRPAGPGRRRHLGDHRPYDRHVTSQTGPRVLLGHGTENDFVVLPDPDGRVWPESRLDEAMVRRLCDRRAGLGGDGVLRVVRSVHVPDAAAVLGEALDRCEWFMDHRNADGSHAEMCGNGIRLFLHVLVTEGLLDRATCEAGVLVGTRGGPRRVGATPDGEYWVDMGPARPFGEGKARLSGQVFAGLAVSMGNPHLACLTDVDLDTLDLTRRAGVRRRAVPRGRQRRADRRPRAGRAHPAAGVRARGGGDPLVRHRRLRRRLRGTGRRRPDRGNRRRRRPRGPPVGPGRRRDDGPHRPGRLVSAGVLCAEWLAA